VRAALFCWVVAVAFAAPGSALDDPAEIDARVVVGDASVRDGAIEATLTNRTPREIRDVRLLIEYVYHWPDEMHPGDESPGRAWPHVVRGPIAPGATEALRFEPPGGLPTAPGRFTPRIQILSFTEQGA
jgi:hypothetical protein